MIFADVVDREAVDLVIADGAWQVDHYLHENPELKRFAYVWLTDTVGWPPAPDTDELEAQFRIDANSAMVDLVGRYPRLRDRAFFLGRPDDLSMDPLGPGLPGDPSVGRRPSLVPRLVGGRADDLPSHLDRRVSRSPVVMPSAADCHALHGRRSLR